MNRQIAKQLLFDVQDVFADHGIGLGLLFGTLLGALRDKDFIAHDANDVDVFSVVNFLQNFDRWRLIVADLQRKGIVVQDVFDNSYCGLVRGDHHVDVFIPTRLQIEYIVTITGTQFHFPLSTFDTVSTVPFLDRVFLSPTDPESCLTTLYGDWKVARTKEEFTYYNSTHIVNHEKSVYSHYITRF